MVSFQSFIERLKISGGKHHRFAEAISIDQSKVIDKSDPNKNNVSSSIDCYVSGHYTDKNGNVLEVKQRYTIYISYHKDSVNDVMTAVRTRILDDFQKKYPGMTVDDTFIPEPIRPLGRDGFKEDEGFYYGSKLFKSLTKSQKLDIDLKTAADMYKRNIGTIRDRY